MKFTRQVLFALTVCITLLNATTSFAVTLLFTSNIPDIFQSDNEANIANLAGYIDSVRNTSKEDVIFIHGGDSLFPNALSVYDKGAHMIDILNVMETDVFMVNQREFAKGLDSLSLRTGEANFPMVLSNIKDLRTMRQVEGTYPYFIFETQEMSLGVLMMMAPTVNYRYLRGTAFVRDPFEEMRKLSAKLRQEGVDKIIVVTEADVIMEYPVSDMTMVDLVLTTHEGKDEVDFSMTPLYAKGGGNDAEVIEIHLDKNKSLSTADIVNYSMVPESHKVRMVVNGYINRLSVVLEQKVGTISTPMHSIKRFVRTEESALANLFADSIRAFRKTDFAVINSGSIRGNKEYEKGTVLIRKDIFKELPFGGRVNVVNITPAELKQVMEHSLSDVENVSGRFLQISGFEVLYDLNKPVGARVLSITQKGHPLEKDSYTLATDDFIKNGGDKYDVFKSKPVISYAVEDPYVWSAVVTFIEEKKTVSPKIDGRLKNINLGTVQ
ncbi:bifunctional metallophosphatase/5'-nucleotidase [Marinomonas algicola]|uniref:bifunctional metallophosphatase/5'-nucleotidase n=1 Tax=Marinomonas algicola TaxID=2773454 RepID=UPI00174C7445|nr:5'-nucleotidase C-terminal domain-containing protein [Marinomonas algicola]